MVIKAEQLAKGYNDRLLFENVNFDLPPGGIVGIIGPNGAARRPCSAWSPTRRSRPPALKVGDSVKLAYVEQSRDLADDAAVWQSIADGQDTFMLGPNQVNVRAYIALGFTGSDQAEGGDAVGRPA